MDSLPESKQPPENERAIVGINGHCSLRLKHVGGPASTKDVGGQPVDPYPDPFL